ncbi:MAG: sigma-70 family polymerase sigma factor, partial [Actinomycetia bacterium]|nr:sigma-70 family polymerase sigma factor [Actinomycetes bacterium]
MRSDSDLLEAFEGGSEESFAAFHEKHYQRVYSLALRDVRNAELANEIAQVVFLRFIQKASSLGDKSQAGAWLSQAARYISLEFLRSEARQRKIQERYFDSKELLFNESVPDRRAREEIREILKQLSAREQEALDLRFFQDKTFSEMAAVMGISEHAAKKRVSRAVDRLGSLLKNKNIAFGSLATFTGHTKTTFAFFMTKIKTGFSVAVLAALAVTPGIYFYSQFKTEQKENAVLTERLKEGTEIQPTVAAKPREEESNKLQEELNQLRNEVGLLRKQKTVIATLSAENEKLKLVLKRQMTAEPATGIEDQTTNNDLMASMASAKQGAMGAIMYADSNNGNLPADMKSISQQLPGQDAVNLGQFEFLPNYRPVKINELKGGPSSTILFRGKEVKIKSNGKYMRAYAFVD